MLLALAELREMTMKRLAFSMVIAITMFTGGAKSSAQNLISRRYVLDRSNSDDAFHAIENAAHEPSDIDWPDLRRRLYKSSLPSGFLRITTIAGRIAISDDTPRPIIDVLADGVAMKWKINDGQSLDVSAKPSGGGVMVTYRGSDYQRTSTYYNIGEKLVEDTTITSPRIMTPIHYKLLYR